MLPVISFTFENEFSTVSWKSGDLISLSRADAGFEEKEKSSGEMEGKKYILTGLKFGSDDYETTGCH